MTALSKRCPGCGALTRFSVFTTCTKCGREGCNDCMAHGTPQLCLECSPSKTNIIGVDHRTDCGTVRYTVVDAAFLSWLDAEIEAARRPSPRGHLDGEELRREATRSALERVKARLVG